MKITMARTLNENPSQLKLDAKDAMAAMKPTTSGQETHPWEGADPCQFCVLSEDQPAYELARETCGEGMDRCGPEFTFAFHFWKFDDLNNPISAQSAAEAIAYADIILISMQTQK